MHINDIKTWFNIVFDSEYSNPLYYAENLFVNDQLITKLTIPNTITEINAYSFIWCTPLTSITIPDSVTSIGENAFSNCIAIKRIEIPEHITSIGSEFNDCESLTTIKIPNSVTDIDGAFSNCISLIKVEIPESVTNFGSAFSGCNSLKEIKISKHNKYYSSINGVVYNKSKTELLKYPSGKSNSVVIPKSVKSIRYNFLEYSHVKKLYLPENVEYMNGIELDRGKLSLYDIYARTNIVDNRHARLQLYVKKGSKTEEYLIDNIWLDYKYY